MPATTCRTCGAAESSCEYTPEKYNHLGHRLSDSRAWRRSYTCGGVTYDVQWGYGLRWGRAPLKVEAPCSKAATPAT